MPENLTTTPAASGLEGYNFAYLDEGTKRMVRRALLKAVAILSLIHISEPTRPY